MKKLTHGVANAVSDRDHLYTVSREAGKVYVFTVTSTSVTVAPACDRES
ncbi:MAG TPA: hypothetical protein VKQ11_08265 [Candidatus Sulfotelmatobacter sp.]|nr:hypothetical protein [Candidatus Sulfotelmatobacter sp.]